MSYFSELSSYRESILTQLTNNPNIVQAIGNTKSDFLTNPDNTIVPSALLYKYIFPYRFICDEADATATYITFYFYGNTGGLSTENDSFKHTYIGFDIYCHYDIIRTDEGCLRFDYIVSQIDEMIHNQKLGESITKATLINHTDFSMYNGKWQGAQLSYSIIDKKLGCK
jgi:hypothetical protein